LGFDVSVCAGPESPESVGGWGKTENRKWGPPEPLEEPALRFQ
jgi:hypothetical protein